MEVLQQLDAGHLTLITLIRISDNTHIARFTCFSLNTLHDVGEVAERHVGHNDANGTRFAIPQTHGKGIGAIAVFFCQFQNLLLQS